MSRSTVVLGCLLLAGLASAHAQSRWVADPKMSLAWWQMSPHLGHLWATTCPGDSSWRPGEGRSSGWTINKNLKMPGSGDAGVDDTVHVPLFPRMKVYASCHDAVKGEVVSPDTVNWRGTLATIQVTSEAFITGSTMRDLLMHQIMQTGQFPTIFFELDSLIDLHRQGDTLIGKAVGQLTFRDKKFPIVSAVKSYPDGGGMRVAGRWRFPANRLKEMAPKLEYVGLGVNTNVWHDFFMGYDIIFRRAPLQSEGTKGGN